jgi:acylphosphatase
MPTVSKRVHYGGQVQGVGFRYTAQAVAAGFPVAGYVRNLPNGEVELVAEGPAHQVDAFLAAVGDRMRHYITEIRVEERPAQGYPDFRIRP